MSNKSKKIYNSDSKNLPSVIKSDSIDLSVIDDKIPSVRSSEASFFNYVNQIQKFPLLSHEEEKEYGEKFQKTGDKNAAKILGYEFSKKTLNEVKQIYQMNLK